MPTDACAMWRRGGNARLLSAAAAQALEAIAAALTDRLRLYPDPLATAFRQAVARRHGVDPAMVLAGNGSDDLLTILTRAFVGPGDTLMIPPEGRVRFEAGARAQPDRLDHLPIFLRVCSFAIASRFNSVQNSAFAGIGSPEGHFRPHHHHPRFGGGR